MSTPDSNSQDSPDAASEMDLLGLYLSVRERWWMIALCLLATCGLGAIYIIKTPKTYAAETIVQVEDSERKIVNIQDISNDDLRATEQLKTIEQNLSSLVVLKGVIDALKLTPEQLNLPPRPDMPPYTEMDLMHKLADSTTIKLQRGTRLISVTLENVDPVLAQKLSTETIKQFIGAYMEQRVGISDDAYSFLADEKERLKKQVVQSEKAVQDFKDAHPGLPLDDSQNLIDSRLLALNTALNDARSARFKLEADASQVNQVGLGKPDDLLRIATVSGSPSVLAMRKNLADAESDFAALTERYKPKHPKYVQAQRKVDELLADFRQTVVKAAEGIGASLDAARETEDKAGKLLKEEEQAKLDFTKISLPYAVLVKDLENDRDLYNSVQRRLKETELTRSMDQGRVHVVQPAYLPEKPSKPKKLLVMIAAVMSGLLIGGLLVFALHAVDQSFRSVDQVEEELGLPAVGSVPKTDKKSLAAKSMLTVNDPDSPVAEAFRSLRAALSLHDEKQSHRSVLFTSAVPSEGKSFCSVNYAVALAQLGERTLIIDGDLRLPTVHTLFFDHAPQTGVGSILLGEASFDEAVRPTGVENLFVLPAGARIAKPAEMIAKGGFTRVIKEALAKFDRVIIDSAPVLAVSDSLLMLKDVGQICLVVQAMKTQRRMVNRALQKIVEADGAVSGIVLNQLPKSGADYYYYYAAGKYGDAVYGASSQAGK